MAAVPDLLHSQLSSHSSKFTDKKDFRWTNQNQFNGLEKDVLKCFTQPPVQV